MPNLGSFGTAVQAVPDADTFVYFGAEYRIAVDFGEAAFIDWMEEFGTVDEDDPKAIVATKALMRVVVHPEDFDAFWKTVRVNRQGSQDLLGVVAKLVEAVTGRPTGQPSGSPGGDAPTQVRSGGGSPSQVTQSLVDKGRPDLALMVVKAQEAQAV